MFQKTTLVMRKLFFNKFFIVYANQVGSSVVSINRTPISKLKGMLIHIIGLLATFSFSGIKQMRDKVPFVKVQV